MVRFDNRYSRFVQFAKIVFPLVALGLLSTLFLFSRTIDPDSAIPFADIDVEQIAKEQRLASPKFSGVTSDGSAISVQAESARPDLTDPRKLSAKTVLATISTQDGNNYTVTADGARFDGTSDELSLMGHVSVESTSGYRLETDELTANLETTGLVAPGHVRGVAPGGTIEAGRMELSSKNGTQLLVFKNGVKLIYDIKK